MGKRKQLKDPEELQDAPARKNGQHEEDESSDEEVDMLDVDFEWFDPQPEVDFHGLKTLVRQLFDVDAQLFNLSELVDLILSQPTLGSTVKTEGNESDPYAFLTVLNLHEHREKQVIKDLTAYVLQSEPQDSGTSTLSDLLSPNSNAQVGLILTERVINMPAEIVPPMYTMLLEEMQWAIEDKEPYEFSHYLILSKTYQEIESSLEEGSSRPSKKQKNNNSTAETFYFHSEDEVLHKHAITYWNYDYSKQGDEGASDSKRAFQEAGIKPTGHAILIDGAQFETAVKTVGEYLGGKSS